MGEGEEDVQGVGERARKYQEDDHVQGTAGGGSMNPWAVVLVVGSLAI